MIEIGDHEEELKIMNDDTFRMTDCPFDSYITDCMHTLNQCLTCRNFNKNEED